MIDELSDVPPAVLLLINETNGCRTILETRKRIKELLPDLRTQSATHLTLGSVFKEEKSAAVRFDIHLHGALDLFAGEGCAALKCRLGSADRLARSVGLIADRVWLSDSLSENFIDFGRITNKKVDSVIDDILVLRRLFPLINAGIVKFRRPPLRTCFQCATEFNGYLRVARDVLFEKFQSDFKLRADEGDSFVVDIGECVTPSMIFRGTLAPNAKLPTMQEFARDWIQQEIQGISIVAQEASKGCGAVFSNSRVGLASLTYGEGRLSDRRALIALDEERSFNVPWVTDLDAGQIIQLRDEASRALPAFREQMARSLSYGTGSASPIEAIHELREQAAEVRSELDAKKSKSANLWKTSFGLLGLGLSAYGVASDQIVPGVGGLLPVLQLLISHKTGFESDVAKLETRPGFVLVKAQDILAHSH